jgi:tetratricopeptide (TPR) repeat protein
MKTNCNFLLVLFSICCVFSCIKNPIDIEKIYYESQTEAGKSNFKEALEIIEAKIPESKHDFAYYRFHGIYTYYQNPQKYAPFALEDFKKSYELRPNSFLINSLIGTCYLTMKNYVEAVKYLEQANNLYEDNMNAPPVYYELAEAYFFCGKVNDALNANNLAIEKDSDYSWNYMQRGIL